MHVLFITGNKRFLEEGSEERELLSMMSDVSDTLHAVVLTTFGDGYKVQQVGDHTWVYPTNSLFKFLYYFDALRVVRRQVSWRTEFYADVVVSDDARVAGLAGLRAAEKYKRVWMVNLHTFYWGDGSLMYKTWIRLSTIPLPTLLQSATRICAFNERARLYVESAATEEQKAKIISFPEVYVEPKMLRTPVDIKAKYPEFNFIILAYVPQNLEGVDIMLGTVALLRAQYPKAGLVLLTNASSTWLRPHLLRFHAADWVRFEPLESHAFPFQNANVFIYLNSGEEEDVLFIHAAAASCPLVAVRSVVSEKLVQHAVNGMLIDNADPQALVAAIRTLNETPGLREQFKVNASMLLHENVLPTREELLERLRAFLFFQYEEGEVVSDEASAQLFERLTHKATLLEKAKAKWGAIRDHYTKL